MQRCQSLWPRGWHNFDSIVHFKQIWAFVHAIITPKVLCEQQMDREYLCLHVRQKILFWLKQKFSRCAFRKDNFVCIEISSIKKVVHDQKLSSKCISGKYILEVRLNFTNTDFVIVFFRHESVSRTYLCR